MLPGLDLLAGIPGSNPPTKLTGKVREALFGLLTDIPGI